MVKQGHPFGNHAPVQLADHIFTPAFAPHPQFLRRTGHGGSKGVPERLRGPGNPPAAAVDFEGLPGGRPGGDDRRARGKGFRHHDAEIFLLGRKYKEFGVLEKGLLEFPLHLPGEGDFIRVWILVSPRFQGGPVTGEVGAGDDELPARAEGRFQAGPFRKKLFDSFLGVQPAEKQRQAFAPESGMGRIQPGAVSGGCFGQGDSIRQNRHRLSEPRPPDIV